MTLIGVKGKTQSSKWLKETISFIEVVEFERARRKHQKAVTEIPLALGKIYKSLAILLVIFQ